LLNVRLYVIICEKNAGTEREKFAGCFRRLGLALLKLQMGQYFSGGASGVQANGQAAEAVQSSFAVKNTAGRH